MNLQLTKLEAAVLADALAKAASRHESQARSIKHGRRHDDVAKQMRQLRTMIIREIVEHDRTNHL